jgi:hypothetical protein
VESRDNSSGLEELVVDLACLLSLGSYQLDSTRLQIILSLRVDLHHAGVACSDDENLRLRLNYLLNIVYA